MVIPVVMASEVPAAPKATDAPSTVAVTEETPATATPVPLLGFTPVEVKNPDEIYTAVKLPGLDYTVYAFNDVKGVTQFRVYGVYNNKTGYFPVNVTAGEEYEEGMPLQFAFAGNEPVKDKQEDAGKAVIPKENVIIPGGFSPARTHGLVYVENLFGTKEYRAYASYDNINFLYLPTKNSRPRQGALGRVPEDMLSRAKIAGEKNFAVPEDLKDGFAELVCVKTADNKDIVVSTDFPELNAGEIRALAAKPVVIYTTAPINNNYVDEEKKTAAQRNHELNTKEEIKQIQAKLNELGYQAGDVDGIVGSKTVAAIKAFQKLNGLSQDGIVGKLTWAKLFADAPATSAPTPQPTDKPEPEKIGEPYFAVVKTSGGNLNVWKSPEVIGKNSKVNGVASLKNGADIGMVQEYKGGYAELLDGTGYVRTGYIAKKANAPAPKPQPSPTEKPEPEKKGEPYAAIASTSGGDLNIWKSPEVIGKNSKINALYSVKDKTDLGMVQEYEGGYAEILDEKGGFVRTGYIKKK